MDQTTPSFCSGGSRISRRGGRGPRTGGRGPPRWLCFENFHVKTKESGPIGGARAGRAPLDPPMFWVEFPLYWELDLPEIDIISHTMQILS